MESDERGMNPVVMTIINPRKEYWPSRGSNQRPPILKSATLPTEFWGWACILNKERLTTYLCRISPVVYVEPHISVGSVLDLRTGRHWFDPWLGKYSFRALMMDQSPLTAVRCFDDGYAGKQPVAWKDSVRSTGK